MTLRFQPTQRQAWLVELDEHSARTQGDLCNRHAAALVLPRGWELHDERVDAADVSGDTPVAKNANGKGVRRVRVRRKAGAGAQSPETESLPGLEAATDAEPAAEPVGDAPAETPAADADQSKPPAPFMPSDDEEVEEALGAILDARTPLLQRAFRNSKPL